MKILVIQTAFIGDVILVTSLLEALHQAQPTANLHLLVRKGNEGLFKEHPFLGEILVFDKKTRKYRNLFTLIKHIRSNRYDVVINVQRYFTTGIITVLSGAKQTIGFNKNPFSLFFTESIEHSVDKGLHEIDRNIALLRQWGVAIAPRPALYPNVSETSRKFSDRPYVCVAPGSVWFSKRLPVEKWLELVDAIPESYQVLLIGGKDDASGCKEIAAKAKHPHVLDLCAQLGFLESAALIGNAKMTYVNDSAPLHLASAMNAPVTAFFCSTSPSYGFTPLSDVAIIAETEEQLSCKPCGLVGKPACPLGHFKCSNITMGQYALK